MCIHVVAENSPCDLASVPRTAIDRFLHTCHMVITHAAAPSTTYVAHLHLVPTYIVIYLKYLSRSAMTDSRRLRPTGGLFRSSTEPAKLVPTYNMRRRVKCEVVPT